MEITGEGQKVQSLKNPSRYGVTVSEVFTTLRSSSKGYVTYPAVLVKWNADGRRTEITLQSLRRVS